MVSLLESTLSWCLLCCSIPPSCTKRVFVHGHPSSILCRFDRMWRAAEPCSTGHDDRAVHGADFRGASVGEKLMLKWKERHPSVRSIAAGAISHAIGEGERWIWMETLWLLFPTGWTCYFCFVLQPDGGWSWRETPWLLFPTGWTCYFCFVLQPDGFVMVAS
jgi:hypothetical protein